MLTIQTRTGTVKSLDNQDRMIRELSEIRSHDGSLNKKLDDLVNNHENLVRQMVEILSSNATSVVRSDGYNRSQASHLGTGLINAVQNSPQQMEDEDVSRLKVSPKRLARVRERFIDIYRYDSMFDREAGVADAHPDTLKWIFNDPSGDTHMWDNIGQWLESDDQLYWITGKMGSGKSTLMKYMSERPLATSATGQEPRCMPNLLRWAKDQPLFIAKFYFWAGSNEETRIQTSVEGLYRTLLTQILEAYPDAAPRVSPRRWENIRLFNRDFNPPGITELKITLAKAIEYVSSQAKVCIFIDGLDEFEGEDDDLKGLITWVKILVKTLPVKLCVSSRPWRVFEDALQDRPQLRMEDFNFRDIQQYVWRTFHDDPNFRDRKKMEAAFCNQLLDDIVTKAEGVFLWVHLVSMRLLQAMSRGDLGCDLSRILNELPVKMEKVYAHILENLDLKDHAAKYFLLMQAFLGQPGALTFSFADDIGQDSEFSFKMSKGPLTQAESEYRVTEMRKRLNSRCRGLLCVSTESLTFCGHFDKGLVHYCHRSAKDYLTMDSVQAKLIDMLDVSFDPHLRLCSAHLAQWKCCASSYTGQYQAIYTCAEHAAKVASENYDMMIRVLDDLDPDFEDLSYIYDYRFERNPWFGGTLLSFAVALGIREYVKRKLGRVQGCVVRSSLVHLASSKWPRSRRWRPGLDKSQAGFARMQDFRRASRGKKVEWPLLLDALLSASPPDPKMVSLLLENGADPNLIVRCEDWNEGALDLVLARLFSKGTDQISPDAKKAWVETLCLLLQHGAKPHKSDVRSLRKFIGGNLIHELKLPHMGRHREFMSKHLAFVGFGCLHGGNLEGEADNEIEGGMVELSGGRSNINVF